MDLGSRLDEVVDKISTRSISGRVGDKKQQLLESKRDALCIVRDEALGKAARNLNVNPTKEATGRSVALTAPHSMPPQGTPAESRQVKPRRGAMEDGGSGGGGGERRPFGRVLCIF